MQQKYFTASIKMSAMYMPIIFLKRKISHEDVIQQWFIVNANVKLLLAAIACNTHNNEKCK